MLFALALAANLTGMTIDLQTRMLPEQQRQSTPSQPYRWKSVQMVGGGFVDGLVFHPKEKGLRYARTDIGGAYRWDDRAKVWEPLLDWVPYEDLNFMGVESIGLDPNDPNKLYLACGTYTNAETPNGAILRSIDRGRTFQTARVPFKMGGNENGRGNGERLAVDPNDGKVLYFGSRHAGLWRSADGAKTWSRVDSFPYPSPNAEGARQRSWLDAGINGVVFDPGSGSAGRSSKTIYVTVSEMGRPNLFRSMDAGESWAPVPGAPEDYKPTHMVLARDGNLYVTYGTDAGPNRMRNGAVWKLNARWGLWTDITPDRPDGQARAFGYAAVSVDSSNTNRLIVSSFYRPPGEELFRSIDGGATYHKIFTGDAKPQWDFSKAPYVARTPIHWLFDIEIDPFDPDHALFTTGYGGYETFNLSNAERGLPTQWSVMSKGIEETVALELASPPAGPHLISAIGDYGGFVHWNLDKPAPEGNFDTPHFGNTTGLAYAEAKPELIVRVGAASGNRGGGNIGYSFDSGRTWQTTKTIPQGAREGSIAVSSDGAIWVWSLRTGSYWTRDRGESWTTCLGVPRGARVVADRNAPNRFWSMSLFDGVLFRSDDGGKSFSESILNLPGGRPKAGGNRGDGRGGQDRLYSTPGAPGDLWLPCFDGVFHSKDDGKTWERVSGVSETHGFGFGKGKSGSYPALYLIGVVKGTRGIFRSDDAGSSWTCINDDAHQWGLLLQVFGDSRIYGRVYVGTHGRGVLYGDPR